MSEWVTQAQAAEILGCHVSNVPKLIAKGQLHTRGATDRKLPSLDRDQVEVLAQRREAEREAQTEPMDEDYREFRPDEQVMAGHAV